MTIDWQLLSKYRYVVLPCLYSTGPSMTEFKFQHTEVGTPRHTWILNCAVLSKFSCLIPVEQFLAPDVSLEFIHWSIFKTKENKKTGLSSAMDEFVFSPLVHLSVSAGTQIDAVQTQTYWLHIGFISLLSPSLWPIDPWPFACSFHPHTHSLQMVERQIVGQNDRYSQIKTNMAFLNGYSVTQLTRLCHFLSTFCRIIIFQILDDEFKVMSFSSPQNECYLLGKLFFAQLFM